MHILRQSELDGMPCPDTLIHGECLEAMKHIADGSVSAIIADLPYGTTACKWDTVIPFTPLWEAYKRVIKPGGAIVLFGCQPFTSRLVCSNLEWFKYDWCWHKPKGTGHLNCRKQPLRDKEDILVFCQSQSVYNPQLLTGEPYEPKGGVRMTECYGKHSNFRNVNNGSRYPKQVIKFGVVERGNVHPTQKPSALLEYLVRTYTNPGDLVLDNTMGSATLPVACLNTGRHFIGIEKDDAYFDIAVTRVRTREIELASTLGL